MPRIFLSPSTQEYNPYVTGGNEELYANLIADAMEPYLRASGIDFTRNDPNGSVSTSIAASNAGNYDFHLAIHSNAAPANLAGMLQGPDVYYYRDSSRSRAAAEIFANNLKLIYPNPELVTVVPTTTLAELRRTPNQFHMTAMDDICAHAQKYALLHCALPSICPVSFFDLALNCFDNILRSRLSVGTHVINVMINHPCNF